MYLYPSIDLKFLFIMPTIALLIFFAGVFLIFQLTIKYYS